MTTAFFGELSEKRKCIWDNKENNPYEVLHEPIELNCRGNNLLIDGKKFFTEQIQIDWGSFAWKSTPEAVLSYLELYKAKECSWLIEDDENLIERVKEQINQRGNVKYGIVFIELY